ncbi:LysM domain-containing protein [Sphingobacteriales bacterium UPWRP_1]|nr:hypothetical protein BVG80_17040 [Sphingobacteriales bacterium TSM_CSM]PSJ74306.1 LysM domain-containing protein [Sphingobacteriales bacterium UPWRP_1]
MKSISTFFLVLFTLSAINAQTVYTVGMAGYWRMKNSAEISEINSLLRILPDERCAFTGTFKRNQQETLEITGMLYEGNLMTAVINAPGNLKSIYTGKFQPDGSIQGTYFSANCVTGTFLWEKVCDDAGKPLKGYQTPCIQQPVYTTQMVKQVQQVAEKTQFTGEPRNENLPLVQGDTNIPPDAVFTGHIDWEEEGITYRTVEVATPVQVPVPAEMFKYTETAKTAEPVIVFSKPDTGEKKGLDVCDTGTTNPGAPKGPVEKGKTVKEAGKVYHIVGKGETMYSITKLYNITIEQLAALNGKNCERLYKGERLRVK